MAGKEGRTNTEHFCELRCAPDRKQPCGRSARFRIVWTLWPFLATDRSDEEGKMIPRAVWLCSNHHFDLKIYIGQFSNDHEDDSLPKKPALPIKSLGPFKLSSERLRVPAWAIKSLVLLTSKHPRNGLLFSL